jgi:hypothetical protein
MSGYQHLDQGRQRPAITLGSFLGSLLEFWIQPQAEMCRFASHVPHHAGIALQIIITEDDLH